jgi:hypothetical protein
MKMKKETKQYKLMRMCNGKMGWGTDWEIQITGSLDECKDYQYQDRIKCEFCNPEYKIEPIE